VTVFFAVQKKDSDLILSSYMHFYLIFVQGDRPGASFRFLHADIQFPQQHLLKRQYNLYNIFWALLTQWRNGEMNQKFSKEEVQKSKKKPQEIFNIPGSKKNANQKHIKFPSHSF
jgi:hypothetical protein